MLMPRPLCSLLAITLSLWNAFRFLHRLTCALIQQLLIEDELATLWQWHKYRALET